MFKRILTWWPWLVLMGLIPATMLLARSHLFMSIAPGLFLLPLVASVLFCSPRFVAAMVIATAIAQAAAAVTHLGFAHRSMTPTTLAVSMVAPLVLYGGMAGLFFYYRRRLRRILKQINGQDDQTVAQLAGGVAHDLSNMLTVALGTARLMARSEQLAPATRSDLETVTDTVRNSTSLVKQLLGVIAGRPLPAETVEVNMLLGKLARQIRPSLPPGIELSILPFPYPLKTAGNSMQLQRCLLNLFMNARDAVGEAGRIELAADKRVVGVAQASRFGVSPGEYVAISVADDGHGISTRTRSRIFRPFFTTKRPGCGNGLGLAIVDELVHEWSGFVEVSSEVDKGSRFDVYLPLAPHPVVFTTDRIAAPTPAGQSPVLAGAQD